MLQVPVRVFAAHLGQVPAGDVAVAGERVPLFLLPAAGPCRQSLRLLAEQSSVGRMNGSRGETDIQAVAVSELRT